MTSKRMHPSQQTSMPIAEKFFSPWELKIGDFDEAIYEINNLADKSGPKRKLVWRGVKSASFPLHSALYRRLFNHFGKMTEAKLVEYEIELLKHAQTAWRSNGVSSMEIMANLQHFAGSTRFIDVTYNPLIALWFSCQPLNDETSPELSLDGRIFVFDVTGREFSIDNSWDNTFLPWQSSPRTISLNRWTGELPFVWKPQSYNERIAAQNSAFLMGGVPTIYSGKNTKYRKKPGNAAVGGTWKEHEVRAATSVSTWMFPTSKAPTSRSTPTFTFRIEESAKSEILSKLEHYYGISTATLFPDVFGMAVHLEDMVLGRHGIQKRVARFPMVLS